MPLTAAHKMLLVGIVLGILATYVWHRRSMGGGGSAPEG